MLISRKSKVILKKTTLFVRSFNKFYHVLPKEKRKGIANDSL